MIHRVEEGEQLRYGLNIETVRHQGWALIVFWRGLTHYYGVRLRLFRYWRWPLLSTWRASIAVNHAIQVRGASCSRCGYWNECDAQVRDTSDGRMFCNNCGEMFTYAFEALG